MKENHFDEFLILSSTMWMECALMNILCRTCMFMIREKLISSNVTFIQILSNNNNKKRIFPNENPKKREIETKYFNDNATNIILEIPYHCYMVLLLLLVRRILYVYLLLLDSGWYMILIGGSDLLYVPFLTCSPYIYIGKYACTFRENPSCFRRGEREKRIKRAPTSSLPNKIPHVHNGISTKMLSLCETSKFRFIYIHIPFRTHIVADFKWKIQHKRKQNDKDKGKRET